MCTKAKVWSVLLLTLMIGVGRTLEPVSTVSATETSQHSNIVICKGKPIPDDYVIIAHLINSDCPFDGTFQENAWVIKIPGDIEEVCKGQQLPKGYVIVDTFLKGDCPNFISPIGNAWLIQRT